MSNILDLMSSFAQVGICAFGGGLSTLGLMEYHLVTKTGWLTANDFSQVVAFSQVTPGPIAINAATFVGFKEGGLIGSFAATLALVAAPLAALYVVTAILKIVPDQKSRKFKKMLRPVVSGLLVLSLIPPLRETFGNGNIAALLFIAAIILINYVKYIKERPSLMLLSFGIMGALILS